MISFADRLDWRLRYGGLLRVGFRRLRTRPFNFLARSVQQERDWRRLALHKGRVESCSPVLGVAHSAGTAAGQLIHTAGLLGILPDAGAAFQLGIRN